MAIVEIKVPDIGDFDLVDVIELIVSEGDMVTAEDPLVTLESDKATMDIPSPTKGVIQTIHVKVGDKVSEGSSIATMETEERSKTNKPESAEDAPLTQALNDEEPTIEKRNSSNDIHVLVPDIGDFEHVDVIEILVAPGDAVRKEDPILTLESDKATMDIPSPTTGVISKIVVEIGNKVSEGDKIASITAEPKTEPPPPESEPLGKIQSPVVDKPPVSLPKRTEVEQAKMVNTGVAHASPSVRKFARQLGVDVAAVQGTGPKGRIQKEDVQGFVKNILSGSRNQASPGPQPSLPTLPEIDHSKYGEITTDPLSKIKKLTGKNLHASWLNIPHVFQMDEADITELEKFRKSKAQDAQQNGAKLTLLSFLVKALVVSLKQFPDFNSSLSSDGESIIRKHYYHIGIAVNTDQGLIVPVVRNVDQKGLYELAIEIKELSLKARSRKINPKELQGACFTISSLGGVGGTRFTPIINPPEVGILGISPSSIKPVWDNNEFVPRLMLPFTLSYDHRVIDGVAAAQFTRYLASVLADIRDILL